MTPQFPRRFLILIGGLVSLSVQAAQPEPSFELRVPAAPMLRSVDGVKELVYELHLDNFAHADLKPVRVEVLEATSARLLAAYEGPALDQRLDRSGVQWKSDSFSAIPSGRRGVVFIELAIADALPLALRHRIGYLDIRADPGAGARHDARPAAEPRWVEGGSTAIVTGRTPVLSPPLGGGPWLAVYDARWERGHRRVGYALGGKLRTPGRYAVDWVKLDSAGRKSLANSGLAAETYSHGQDVLAVADGVIVQVNDEAAERTRLSDKLTSTQGNHLVLKLDSGEFVHYGHLRPGSATRTAGTRVKAGDKLAEVGFSGSASDPQLHFALTDGPDELASEGLAYEFDRYRLLGRYADVAQVGAMPWVAASPQTTKRSAMPAPMAVVEWFR